MLLLLTTAFLSCKLVEDPDLPDVDTEDKEDDLPKEPTDVFLDNTAEWRSVFCFLIIGDDGVERKSVEMLPDEYGIYTVTVPAGVSRIAFGNGEGEQTDIMPLPTKGNVTYDNLLDSWKSYADAIKNTLTLGDNDIRVTPAHKEDGGQYLLFHAEQDGRYTFISASGFTFNVVATEYNNGNWEADSSDWINFLPGGDSVTLTAGYYYVHLGCADPYLFEGLHSVRVNYSDVVDEPCPLLNSVFTDGKITVCFFEREEPLMSVIRGDEEIVLYSYRITKVDGGYRIELTLRSGSEYQVSTYPLSVLSRAGNVRYSGGVLYFLDQAVPRVR